MYICLSGCDNDLLGEKTNIINNGGTQLQAKNIYVE